MIKETPYGGTSGHSGTTGSRDRATERDDDGRTALLQEKIISEAFQAKFFGVTVTDIKNKIEPHHGSASGALSVLDMTGHLVCLEQRRGRCHIYVLPEYVNLRERAKKRKPAPCINCGFVKGS